MIIKVDAPPGSGALMTITKGIEAMGQRYVTIYCDLVDEPDFTRHLNNDAPVVVLCSWNNTRADRQRTFKALIKERARNKTVWIMGW